MQEEGGRHQAEHAERGVLRRLDERGSSRARAHSRGRRAIQGEQHTDHEGAVAELRNHFSALRSDFISSWYPGLVPSWGALYSSECLAMICVAWK